GIADANVSGGKLTIGSEDNPVIVNIGDIMNIATNVAGTGEVIVRGSNSELNAGPATHAVGSGGHTGILTITDNATANYAGSLSVGVSAFAASQGTVTVEGVGTFNTGNINIATSANATSGTGTINVSGVGSTITQTLGGATLNIGSASGGTGTLNVQSSGTFTTGTGTTTINNTGTIDVQGGTFNANGNMNVNGGTIQSSSLGTINLGSGTVLSVSNDGRVGSSTPFDIDQGAMVNVDTDGELDINNLLTVGRASSGTLTVDGNGSLSSGFDFSVGSFHLGIEGGLGVATFLNSANAIVSQIGSPKLQLAVDDQNASQAELNVLSGASLKASDLFVATEATDGTSASVVIDGSGSVLDGITIRIGHATEGEAIIDVTNGGNLLDRFSSGVTIYKTGVVNVGFVGAGTFDAGDIFVDGGSLNVGSQGIVDLTADGTVTAVNSANFEFASNFTIEDGETFDISDGATFSTQGNLQVGGAGNGVLTVHGDNASSLVEGALTIASAGILTLDGGSIIAESWEHNLEGTFNFISGSLTVNDQFVIGPDDTNNENLTLGFLNTLTTPTTTIDAGQVLRLSGGTLVTDNLNVNGVFSFEKGTLELTGGTITGITSLAVPTGGTFRAQGVHALRISGSNSSSIVATGELTLGDAASTSGFYTNGMLSVGGNTVTLNDANDVVFDSGASVDFGNSDGTLVAENGLTLDFGGNITGFGTLDTPDDSATPLINNGHITGNSGTEEITLAGYIKGVGTCDNCNISGTDAPGFSTAAVNRGSVRYNGTLEIEIGGVAPGSGHDQLNHILGAGVASLGGRLDVQLLSGFTPEAGNTFDILTASGGLAGTTFDTENLPDLSGGIFLEVIYGTTTVQLAVAGVAGDYNYDGTVDAADYTTWRDTLGQTGAGLAADGDASGTIDIADYNLWKTNFGLTAPAALEATTVPEPSALILMLLAMVGFRRARQTHN
ncbi:MAG: beta strand repeat-containing protein, partial [Aeoliella sp.]